MTDQRVPATAGVLDGLLVLLGAGLLTGLLDAGWFTFQRVVLHQITFIPPEALWVAPPVYAAVFLGRKRIVIDGPPPAWYDGRCRRICIDIIDIIIISSMSWR